MRAPLPLAARSSTGALARVGDAAAAPAPGDAARQLELLTAIASRTANGVIVTDRGGRIEWVNDGFTRLTGYEASEAGAARPESSTTSRHGRIANADGFDVVASRPRRAAPSPSCSASGQPCS